MPTPERPKPTPLHGIDLSKARIVNDPEEIRKILEYEEPAPKPDQPPLPTPPNEGKETASPELPTELILGDRTYEILSSIIEGESSVLGQIAIQRARSLGVNTGEEDCRYFIDHQNEIPANLRSKKLLFPKWRDPADARGVACLTWDGVRWYQSWVVVDGRWYFDDLLVRRRQGPPSVDKAGYSQQTLEQMTEAFQCSLDQIAFTPQEINENTKAYVGAIAKISPNPATSQQELLPEYRNFFQTLPPTIEHIYVQYPEKKIRREEIEIGGKTAEELKKDLIQSRIKISDMAEYILRSKEFVTSKETEQVILIRLTVADIGFKASATTEQIFQRAQELGLELCSADTGPHYRLKYQNQPLNEWIYIGMKQMTDSDGDPNVFRLGCIDGGLWLSLSWTGPGRGWNPNDEFVFRLRKLKSS